MNQIKIKLFVIITFCFIVTLLYIHYIPPLHAQIDSTLNMLGHFSDIRMTDAVFIEGNTAYIEMIDAVDELGSGIGSALAIVDVSTPSNPLLIGKSDMLLYYVHSVHVVDTIAYIGDASNGLVTMDVSDPTDPTLLGSVDTIEDVFSVIVLGDIAYIAGGSRGLILVDVSNPANPTLLASVDTGYTRRVATVGNIAYIANSNGLAMVDVTNPITPTTLALLDTISAHDVAVLENIAYVADSNGLMIVDVTDPTTPQMLGSVDTPGAAHSVSVLGDIAYIADGGDGLVMIDVSDHANPILTDLVDVYSEHVNIVNDVIYVTGGGDGLYMFEYVDELSTMTNAPTATNTPTLNDNLFEENDKCAWASTIETNGSIQMHTFHDVGDVDWVRFDVEMGKRYGVIGNVPLGSPADLVMEIYDGCNGAVEAEQGHSFAPGVRLDFEAPTSGTYYLKVYNNQANVFGDDVTYSLSVREMVDDAPQSAVIIVAGKHSDGDVLQENIHHVTNNVYKMYRRNGHDGLRMQYFATDLTLDPMGTGEQVVDGYATVENLEQAITSWAINRVDEDQALTIYMMSHGDYDRFFLDGENEVVTPAQLDGWLVDDIGGGCGGCADQCGDRYVSFGEFY